MTEDQMFDHIREQTRKGVDILEAFSVTTKKAGGEILPFCKGENHLYIRCDGVISDVKIFLFLASSNGLNVRIVSITKTFEVDGKTYTPSVPHLRLYK